MLFVFDCVTITFVNDENVVLASPEKHSHTVLRHVLNDENYYEIFAIICAEHLLFCNLKKTL